MKRSRKQPQSRSRRATRADAKLIDCPACAALPGFPCIGVRGRPRVSLHAARITELRRLDRG